MPDGSSPSPDPARELRALMAEGRFQDALAAFERAEDPGVRRRPELLLLAASAATRVGNWRAGASHAEAALDGFEARADADGQMRALNLLGILALEQGHLTGGVRQLDRALHLARQLGDSLMTARVSNNLASAVHQQGKLAAALSLFRASLLSYQRLGDRRGTAETYHNLGVVFRQQEEWSEAEEASSQAVRHAELVQERALVAQAMMGRAEIHLDRRELAVARRELARAAQIAAEAHDEIGLAEAARLRALMALNEGDAALALSEAEAAHAAALAHGSALQQAECVAVAARALRAAGRGQEAEARRVEAVRLFGVLGAVKWLADFAEKWEGDASSER
ncbi:MAG TPA: tetratricopeptide repeat protein [Gemmatimonadales bacterium]|nr:tetratricopeptide repeat protein [Gemmatimonadales bacterium]